MRRRLDHAPLRAGNLPGRHSRAGGKPELTDRMPWIRVCAGMPRGRRDAEWVTGGDWGEADGARGEGGVGRGRWRGRE